MRVKENLPAKSVKKSKTVWKRRAVKSVPYLVLGVCILMGSYCPAFAASGSSATLTSLLTEIINQICVVFSGVGIIYTAFNIGKMIMALRTEDSDAQQRASMALLVGVALICIGPIVNGFDLVDKLFSY